MLASAADISKWKESIMNQLNDIHNKEKQCKDIMKAVDSQSLHLEKIYMPLYKTTIDDFKLNSKNIEDNDILNLHNKLAENTAKIYNAAIAREMYDIQVGTEQHLKRLNNELKNLKEKEKKVKYELALIPESLSDAVKNIYTFIQEAISNISDDFTENYISIIYSEIMHKQRTRKYADTISSSVNQYSSKTMLKKITEKIFKKYEETMLNFTSAYFKISNANMYDKQNEIRNIIHDFENAFKHGVNDWLIYCTNSETIPSFKSSAVAKSMTMSRMQSYNQRIESSEILFITKYLSEANDLLKVSTWFDEDDIKNATKNDSKETVIRVEDVDDEKSNENKVEASVEKSNENKVEEVKVEASDEKSNEEKSITGFCNEIGMKELTINEITDAYNAYFGTKLSKIAVGKKLTESKLFNKDVKHRVTVYSVKQC